MEQEEEQLYYAVLKLWPIGEVAPKELFFKKEINYGMLQLEKVDYLVYFYEHQLGEALILDEVFDIIAKDKNIVGWIVTIGGQLIKLKLGSLMLNLIPLTYLLLYPPRCGLNA